MFKIVLLVSLIHCPHGPILGILFCQLKIRVVFMILIKLTSWSVDDLIWSMCTNSSAINRITTNDHKWHLTDRCREQLKVIDWQSSMIFLGWPLRCIFFFYYENFYALSSDMNYLYEGWLKIWGKFSCLYDNIFIYLLYVYKHSWIHIKFMSTATWFSCQLFTSFPSRVLEWLVFYSWLSFWELLPLSTYK